MTDKRENGTSGNIKVSVVIVHWNTETDLANCLNKILDSNLTDYEIIVVDNFSDNIDTIPWRDYKGKARLIRNMRNEGYARATNQGVAVARGEYVLLLNPDVELNAEGVRRMVEAIEDDAMAGAATARLVWPDGGFQRYYTRFPTVAALVARLTILEPALRNTSLVRNYLKTDMDPEIAQRVETAPGACLLIKNSSLERIGPMDERLPLFFNDVDYCIRLRNAGLGIVYEPRAVFVHESQASVKKLDQALWRAELRLSAVRYIRKHHGSLKAFALKWILTKDLIARQAAGAMRKAARERGGADARAGWKGIAMVLKDESLFDDCVR
ncbi:MAG: glycosyltransferase family 2 protein [bacterium]